MTRQRSTALIPGQLALCLLAALPLVGCQARPPSPATELVRYGGMHEAIGQRRHHGRVGLAEVVDRPHFHGVGALEGLGGEITILDSVAVVTEVAPDGRPQALSPADRKATLLVGQSIAEWTSLTLGEAIPHDRFDETVAATAAGAGVDRAAPFAFVIEGVFTDVRLHVINGACPIHARLKNLALDENQRPFELEVQRLAGTLVGVYAADAVGELTHPATSTHAHLVYADPETGERVTGHLERVGLASGARLKLPGRGAPAATARR